MAVGGMIVIVGPVQVGGHDADIVRAVLPVQILAVFQSGNLRQRVSFIGLFQLAGQQASFRHRLGSHARIDAGASQKLQLFAAVLPRGMDHIHFQDHVIIHEIRKRLLIGHDASHLRGRKKHVFRFLPGKKGFHRILAAQIQLLVGAGDDIVIALTVQLPHNGGANHAAVSRHVDFRIFFHHNNYLLSL